MESTPEFVTLQRAVECAYEEGNCDCTERTDLVEGRVYKTCINSSSHPWYICVCV